MRGKEKKCKKLDEAKKVRVEKKIFKHSRHLVHSWWNIKPGCFCFDENERIFLYNFTKTQYGSRQASERVAMKWTRKLFYAQSCISL